MFFDNVHRMMCTQTLNGEPVKPNFNEFITGLKQYEWKEGRNGAVLMYLSEFVTGPFEKIRNLCGPYSVVTVHVDNQVISDIPTTHCVAGRNPLRSVWKALL